MKQRWAPWRLEYIKSAGEEPGCVFCAAVEGDDEERLVVHRGQGAIVLLNKFPYASGHFMVAPNRHVGEFGDLDDEEVVALHRLARPPVWARSRSCTRRRRTTSAGTWVASQARASSTTSTCTSSPAGPGKIGRAS